MRVVPQKRVGRGCTGDNFPYEGSPEYRRLYYGNYTIFYVIDGDDMDIRRILWSGADDIDKL